MSLDICIERLFIAVPDTGVRRHSIVLGNGFGITVRNRGGIVRYTLPFISPS